jgi:hypothetical protein
MTFTATAGSQKVITGVFGMEVVRGRITAATTGTYISKFGTILAVIGMSETSAGTFKATWSSSTVTVTATQNDYVGFVIFGY